MCLDPWIHGYILTNEFLPMVSIVILTASDPSFVQGTRISN